jgi:LuxR family maltose regulon positive regulatory protein
VALARRIRRPFLEFGGLAYLATVAVSRSVYAGAALGRSRQAIELAERHGWTDEPPAGLAYVVLAAGLAWQGRLDEAGDWIQRAERTVKEEAEPAAAIGVHYIRGQLELARGRDVGALAAFQTAERLAERLAAPHLLVMRVRGFILRALVRLGETERAEHVLSALSDQDHDRGEIRIAIAVLRLAQDDARAAAAVLAPVLNGAAPIALRTWVIEAFLLQAISQDALGEPAAAGSAVEQALNLAESDHALSGFLLFPIPRLLERHALECPKHAALISEIVSLLSAEPRGTRWWRLLTREKPLGRRPG